MVTPERMPQLFASLISSRSAVSMKNFMSCPPFRGASGRSFGFVWPASRDGGPREAYASSMCHLRALDARRAASGWANWQALHVADDEELAARESARLASSVRCDTACLAGPGRCRTPRDGRQPRVSPSPCVDEPGCRRFSCVGYQHSARMRFFKDVDKSNGRCAPYRPPCLHR